MTVLDANDNTPIFLEFPEDVRIPEDSPTQTVIGEIRTTDLDINQNAQVSHPEKKSVFCFLRLNLCVYQIYANIPGELAHRCVWMVD